jgi:hypothetical protein
MMIEAPAGTLIWMTGPDSSSAVVTSKTLRLGSVPSKRSPVPLASVTSCGALPARSAHAAERWVSVAHSSVKLNGGGSLVIVPPFALVKIVGLTVPP